MNETNSQDVKEDVKMEEKVETIGSYLKKMREAKKISLEEVSQRTKILLTVLKELESDNLKELPGKTYIRGFAKSYAKEIGADVAKTLNLLDKSYSHLPHQKQVVEDDDRDLIERFEEDMHNLPNSFRSFFNISLKVPFIILVVITVIAIPIYHIIKVTHESIKENLSDSKDAPVTSQVPDSSITATINPEAGGPFFNATSPSEPSPMKTDQEIKIVPKKEDTPLITTNSADLSTVISTVATENPVTKIEDSKIEVKEVKKEETAINPDLFKKASFPTRPFTLPLFSIKENAKETEDSSLLPDDAKQKAIKGKQNIFITAFAGDSWITYKRDAEPVRTFTIQKGKSIFIQGDEVRIFMGNINATKVFYNNKLLEPQAPSGVKSLVFPEQSASKYNMPLFIRLTSGKTMATEEYLQIEESKRPEMERAIGLPPSAPSSSTPAKQSN